MKIPYRHSRDEKFDNLVDLKIGMVIESQVNDDLMLINTTLPYVDFLYIVVQINKEEVIVRDTSHNNRWTLTQENLLNCELANENIHSNVNQIDADIVNQVLLGNID